jgi:predicted nucleic-acid-binding Zn-ribbon protein
MTSQLSSCSECGSLNLVDRFATTRNKLSEIDNQTIKRFAVYEVKCRDCGETWEDWEDWGD